MLDGKDRKVAKSSGFPARKREEEATSSETLKELEESEQTNPNENQPSDSSVLSPDGSRVEKPDRERDDFESDGG